MDADQTNLGLLAGDQLWPFNPAGSPLYVPAAPMTAVPWKVPTYKPEQRVAIHPEFADLSQRPALIGFDFTKRHYIGI